MPGTDNLQIIITRNLAYYKPWLQTLMFGKHEWIKITITHVSTVFMDTLLKGCDCFEKQYDFSAGLMVSKIWIINTSY